MWATGCDGSAWYRHGVTLDMLTGTCWYHVPPPNGKVLKQISVGDREVYTIDKNSMHTSLKCSKSCCGNTQICTYTLCYYVVHVMFSNNHNISINTVDHD